MFEGWKKEFELLSPMQKGQACSAGALVVALAGGLLAACIQELLAIYL